jgi:hypothetical protein
MSPTLKSRKRRYTFLAGTRNEIYQQQFRNKQLFTGFLEGTAVSYLRGITILVNEC